MNKKVLCKSIFIIILAICILLLSTYTVKATSTPAKVTGAKVVLKTDANVKVPYFTWNAVSGAKKYEIYTGYNTPAGDPIVTVDTNYFSGGEEHLIDAEESYWIRAISEDGEDGEFSDSFNYFAKPNTPTNLKVVRTSENIKLTWNKVNGAIGYYIYVYTRTPGTNEITHYQRDYVISNFATTWELDSNQMYTVQAVTEYPTTYGFNKKVFSDISNYATYRSNITAPSGITSTVQNGKVDLSWNNVVDADGYQIYDGNNLIKTTSSTSCTISDLSTSKIHTLKIRAYANDDFNKTKFYSSFSSINVFPNAISNVKTSLSGKTNIKITWNKKSNVTGYKIYRSTSKNSGYKQIKKITSKNTSSYTDKNLSKGKVYYYKVVPYLKNNEKEYNGATSNISKIKTFTDSKITGIYLSTEAGSSNTYVYWNKSSNNLDGYEIYRATSKNGKYKKVKTITSVKTSSYTDKKLTKGQTYYYKIRGYKKINDKKYYTKYSSVKSIKVSYIRKDTSIPHKAYTYYGDCVTIKNFSMKYKKNVGNNAIYQIKMKLKIESTASNDLYYTIEFYDKNGYYLDYTTLQFTRKYGNYTKTITWDNVKVPKKATSFIIK